MTGAGPADAEPISRAEAQRELTRARRAGARLAAVQALYQMEQTQESVNAVIQEFLDDRLGLGAEGEPIEEADPDIFRSVVLGVVERQDEIDAAISRRLASGWRIDRLDATSRAILRAGVLELMSFADLPRGVILSEYVAIAHAFFDDKEGRFVNGVMDAVAGDVRPGTG
ncbi:transcription antitermination factor NusB [bacterium]|nr:transcription antitermination factor NusB [bacterium]